MPSFLRYPLLWACFVVTGLAYAHKPSDSYLTLKVEGREVQGQWDIALRDLDFAIGLDQNLDGEITWGEIKAKHGEIAAYALSRLQIAADNVPCPARVSGHLVDNHSDGAYEVLRFLAECPRPPKTMEAAYALFFDLDPQHKGLLNLQYRGQSQSAIFSPAARRHGFELSQAAPLRQFLEYVKHGIWHIWTGFDHILFLLSLLLPAVLVFADEGWRAAPSFRGALLDVLKIVTAFTLAHSITLTLAAIGLVALPSRLVESAIAASVVLAALNNVLPVFQGRRWVVAFAFGLIHGFGFASVLADLGLPENALLVALVGFNAGVEVGQIAIVGIFFPLAFALRDTCAYRRMTLMSGSLAVMAIAGTWFLERVFNFKVLPI